MLANGKLFRQIESRASNPNYTFTASTESFSLGEVSAPIVAFGDLESGTVNRTLVEYFFRKSNGPCYFGWQHETDVLQENERFPTELGWSTRKTPVTQEQIVAISGRMANATNLLSDSNSAQPEAVKARDLHAGL